ncbi:hypothetical protein BTVI_06363 [Pitangus sulphuratus]|nr:hypothetical protein BTVI_06363 [Pitangus sulphuratus]
MSSHTLSQWPQNGHKDRQDLRVSGLPAFRMEHQSKHQDLCVAVATAGTISQQLHQKLPPIKAWCEMVGSARAPLDNGLAEHSSASTHLTWAMWQQHHQDNEERSGATFERAVYTFLPYQSS